MKVLESVSEHKNSLFSTKFLMGLRHKLILNAEVHQIICIQASGVYHYPMGRLCSLYLSQSAIMGVKEVPDLLWEVLN